MHRNREESRPSWCQEKTRGLWTNVVVLYLDENEEQNEGFWDRFWGMVGGYKRIFYKGVGEEFDSTKSWWKNFEAQLEAYQKNFPDFIYGNPTNTEILGQDENTEIGLNGIAQEEEVKIEEPQDLKSGVV